MRPAPNWFRRLIPRIRDSVRRMPPAAASALRYRGRMRGGILMSERFWDEVAPLIATDRVSEDDVWVPMCPSR